MIKMKINHDSWVTLNSLCIRVGYRDSNVVCIWEESRAHKVVWAVIDSKFWLLCSALLLEEGGCPPEAVIDYILEEKLDMVEYYIKNRGWITATEKEVEEFKRLVREEIGL
jgi:hypothetical protein